MKTIEIGQLYRKVSAPSIIWRVIESGIDRDGIVHVRLLSLTDHTHSILIAESVVMRTHEFAPEDAGPAQRDRRPISARG